MFLHYLHITKMVDSKILLALNDFDSRAPNTFRKLWNDKDFTDVTLATVDNQQIRAHKVILSFGSQLFRNILLKNPHQNPLLYLKDIRHKEMEMVMKFIYLGQCDLEQCELEDFLAAGKYLEVSGLIEDVYFKKYKEEVVENEIHEVQFKQH